MLDLLKRHSSQTLPPKLSFATAVVLIVTGSKSKAGQFLEIGSLCPAWWLSAVEGFDDAEGFVDQAVDQIITFARKEVLSISEHRVILGDTKALNKQELRDLEYGHLYSGLLAVSLLNESETPPKPPHSLSSDLIDDRELKVCTGQLLALMADAMEAKAPSSPSDLVPAT